MINAPSSLFAERKYSLIYKEFICDITTPVLVLQKLRAYFDEVILLESVQQNEKVGRFSLIGLQALLIYKAIDNKILVKEKEKNFEFVGDPISTFFKIMETIHIKNTIGEFPLGAIGYFGYDSIRFIENIPNQHARTHTIPDIYYVIPKIFLVFDHIFQTLKIVCCCNEELDFNYKSALATIDNIKNIISQPVELNFIEGKLRETDDFNSNTTKKEYLHIVEQAKEHIRKGDIFQVVLSQQFSVPCSGEIINIYRYLRRYNPSPYMFYLHLKEFQIVGSSPEVLFKKQKNEVVLKPIAGTIKRGLAEEEDKILEKKLINDEKEIAEHMMLVDLGRNDLGRVCKFGTVKPKKTKYIENYSHVKHVVSEIVGEIRQGVSLEDLLRATFPAGTLSGAPKIRAMEIIDFLEKQRRNIYGGALGIINFNGDCDLCIVIRTVIIHNNYAYIQAGAGIVYDSIPENEYNESLDKAKILLQAVHSSNFL